MEGWEAIGWAWGIMKLFFAERGWDTLWETVAGLPSSTSSHQPMLVLNTQFLRVEGLDQLDLRGQGTLLVPNVAGKKRFWSGRENPPKTCCLPKCAREQSSKENGSWGVVSGFETAHCLRYHGYSGDQARFDAPQGSLLAVLLRVDSYS